MTTPEQQLQHCRARIDATDESIAQLLISRIGIIQEVAKLKAQHWPNACHIRPGREGQMHQAIAKRFAPTPFPARMALAIWRQLIGGSTHVESPLNIAYLAEYPEHYFLGREYFGVQIGATKSDTLTHALESLNQGKSNMLILPLAAEATWWRDAKMLHDASLFIFAALPVEANNLAPEFTPALAFAPVAPEDSGDDISYFLLPDGSIHTIDGFTTTHENAIFLGAHPRPIRLTAGVMYA